MVHEATCYVNGLYDLLTWHGATYDYFLLPSIGGMGGFGYLRFKTANPPCMVYWGNSPKYFLQELAKIIGYTQVISEGKVFKNEFPKILKILANGTPVLVGALDMYYLHYYPDLYQKEHVPIHYLLFVGFDDDKKTVSAYDCSFSELQEISFESIEYALRNNVPGISKKNTYRIFNFPAVLPTERDVAERGFKHKAERMLHPPVALVGIPAMRKLQNDISSWKDKRCFNHMVAYAGLTPPLIQADLPHNDGMRFEQSKLLQNLGNKYDKPEWIDAAKLFSNSGNLIIRLCEAGIKFDGLDCSKIIREIADLEESAYKILIE